MIRFQSYLQMGRKKAQKAQTIFAKAFVPFVLLCGATP
jgi:hypothetical protein